MSRALDLNLDVVGDRVGVVLPVGLVSHPPLFRHGRPRACLIVDYRVIVGSVRLLRNIVKPWLMNALRCCIQTRYSKGCSSIRLLYYRRRLVDTATMLHFAALSNR